MECDSESDFFALDLWLWCDDPWLREELFSEELFSAVLEDGCREADDILVCRVFVVCCVVFV